MQSKKVMLNLIDVTINHRKAQTKESIENGNPILCISLIKKIKKLDKLKERMIKQWT